MLKHTAFALGLAISLGLTFGSAQASTTYTLGSVVIDANNTGSGLQVQTAVIPSPGFDFNLNDGESFTFNLFKIWTEEGAFNPDDTVGKPISVDIQFSTPPAGGSGGIVGGTTDAVTLLGVFRAGVVTFDEIDPIEVGGFVYTIELSDEIFNLGLFGFTPGQKFGATVEATIHQISSVPEPTTIALAFSGLGALGLVRLRGRRKAKASAC